MDYKYIISSQMQAVADVLIEAFEGMDHCITSMGRNLVVEVPKNRCDAVRSTLKQHFPDVTLMRKAYPIIEDLHDFILIKPLVSEAPLFDNNGVFVPNLEKLLVDHAADKEYADLDETALQKEFQRAFELYPVNTSRLLRYAGRKGKKEEILRQLERLDRNRIQTIHTIQDYFKHEPVERAWLFGSFSRMEEKPDSDIDILVDLDTSAPIGLLQYAGMINSLEKLVNREIDLVTNGTVKPFALNSIDHDKILIYERT